MRVFTGFEPFAFYEGDELVGFDIDILRSFADHAGLQLALNATETFDGLWFCPADGECDLATAGIARFTERLRADVEWSEPYFEVLRSILIHRERAQELRDITDFDGHSIAFVRGSSADLDTRARAPAGTRLMPVENQVQGMTLLESGKIDGLAMGAPSNAYNRQMHPEFLLIDVHEFSQSEGLRFPMAASNPALLNAMNDFISKATASGQIATFLERWITNSTAL